MYWPLGAPRSYVQQLPLELSSPDPDDSLAVPNETPRTSVDETTSVENHGPKDDANAQDGARASEQGTKALNDNGNIMCLRASRHGHIFATITTSSLTVWQTQVGCPGPKQ
jgi:hypothetical protein